MTTRDTDSLSATQEALAAHATDAWDIEQQADCARLQTALAGIEGDTADGGDSWLIEGHANPREWMVADAEDSVHLGDWE
jgi:hypothetical protein